MFLFEVFKIFNVRNFERCIRKAELGVPWEEFICLQVKSFATKDELNYWLKKNPMRVPGALHFVETNSMEIRFGLQTNSSSCVSIGRQIEDPNFKFRIPL